LSRKPRGPSLFPPRIVVRTSLTYTVVNKRIDYYLSDLSCSQPNLGLAVSQSKGCGGRRLRFPAAVDRKWNLTSVC